MLANIPATQTVIEITGRRARDAGAGDPSGARAKGRRGIDPDRRRRGQPRRLPAAHGTLPDALRRSGYPRPRMLGHRGQARRRGNRVAGRRPGLRADGRRRLWRIRRGAVGAVPTDPGRCQPSRRRGACPTPSARCGPTCSKGCVCERARYSWLQGGSSGIGVTAIQLGKAFGVKVLATAGSDEKCQACRDFAASSEGVNYFDFRNSET